MAADKYKYFRIEAAELLDLLTRGVLALEKEPSHAGNVGALLRHAHTLKGAARVVRQLDIADAAHALEDELSLARSDAPLNIESSLRLLDTISNHLKLLGEPSRDLDAAPAAPARPVVRADAAQLASMRDGIGESLVDLAQLGREAEELSTIAELAELIERQSLTRRLSHPQQYETLLASIHSVVAELLTSLKRFDRSFGSTLDRVCRELEQARLTAEEVQLVSADTVFDNLRRAVRDASSELGKDVRFECTDGNIRLDSHVLDSVHRALLHLVRNAVAHGVESTERRRIANKPEKGTVRISVTRQDRRLCFVCEDDGAGIDVEKIRLRVGARGSPMPDLSDDEAVLQALLQEGISTAPRVSSVAGRGIGMSAVKEATASVGGTLHLVNSPGRGARFELRVPVTLSAVSGLSVVIGDEGVVLALRDVERTLSIGATSLVTSGPRSCLRLDSELVPYVALSHALERSSEVAARIAVVLVHESRRFAVGVSLVLGCQTQVMRRLPAELPPLPLVEGVVLDARGLPQLVLSTSGLWAAAQEARPEVAKPKPTRAPILVVDDSLTTRMLEQSILESAGYDVHLATSAEQAMELASKTTFSLFLVDVEMPGMDGFEFVSRTRADAQLRQVPAILVSSRSSASDLAKGRSAGAAAYIVKDHFDQRELLRQIHALLGD